MPKGGLVIVLGLDQETDRRGIELLLEQHDTDSAKRPGWDR